MKTLLLLYLVIFPPSFIARAQSVTIPYGGTTPDAVKQVMDRVWAYVDRVTPVGIVDGKTGAEILDLGKARQEAILLKTEYGIATHEWGLTYSGMLLAAETTSDRRYFNYVATRFKFLAKAAPYFRMQKKAFPKEGTALDHFLDPASLDDTGSMTAALLQGLRAGIGRDLLPEIERSIRFIMTEVYRLPDGTFARNRPMPNTVWVDDLYQGIPALAEMGRRTGEQKYYDEAARQVKLFAEKLFDSNKEVCMHGWVEDMNPHPAFFWARANGWAIMAIAVLLDCLPDEHPDRNAILSLFRRYCHGLATCQSATGLWHQLLDRKDSFLETSASAMFTFVFAHGINRGWLDIRAYGPAALLGWNAVSTKVNATGQVDGTSAGTSIAFDAAFYEQRPVGMGPHGYGSVLLAGAAMYKLLSEHRLQPGNGPVMFEK